MAGDWIKVEQATLDKAEVLRMAELLGIKRRECLGLLLDFWSWLDNNACAENVPNLSRQSLDDLVNEPGFAAAMEAVGWIKWDDARAIATITNYQHHNGASAKSRAYEQKKKKNQRLNASPKCPADFGTREEIEKSTTSLRSVGARTTRIPLDWQPSPADLAFAKERVRADAVAGQVEAFRTYWLGAVRNATSPDWSAKWRTWVMKAVRDYGAAAPDALREAAL